jgi:hypothetical protein
LQSLRPVRRVAELGSLACYDAAMTESDLKSIESKLSIQLPEVYRQRMLDFPVRACGGNSDTDLWDEAAAIVRYNQELRSARAWPAHMFAIGGRDGCPVAIDLRKSEAPVWWVEAESFKTVGTGQTHASFTSWTTDYVKDMRHDLEADGLDPDSSPAEKKQTEDEVGKRVDRQMLITVIVFLVVVVAGILLLRWWLKS